MGLLEKTFSSSIHCNHWCVKVFTEGTCGVFVNNLTRGARVLRHESTRERLWASPDGRSNHRACATSVHVLVRGGLRARERGRSQDWAQDGDALVQEAQLPSREAERCSACLSRCGTLSTNVLLALSSLHHNLTVSSIDLHRDLVMASFCWRLTIMPWIFQVVLNKYDMYFLHSKISKISMRVAFEALFFVVGTSEIRLWTVNFSSLFWIFPLMLRCSFQCVAIGLSLSLHPSPPTHIHWCPHNIFCVTSVVRANVFKRLLLTGENIAVVKFRIEIWAEATQRTEL